MMRKYSFLITVIAVALFLCAFKSGYESDAEKNPEEHTGPVVTYKETVSPQKSSEELYHEYHLLSITSLEEAQNSIFDDQRWAYRMVDNAYRYLQLLIGLLEDDHKDAFSQISKELKIMLSALKKKNLAEFKKTKINDNLKNIAKLLGKDYKYSQAKPWIKK